LGAAAIAFAYWVQNSQKPNNLIKGCKGEDGKPDPPDRREYRKGKRERIRTDRREQSGPARAVHEAAEKASDKAEEAGEKVSDKAEEAGEKASEKAEKPAKRKGVRQG